MRKSSNEKSSRWIEINYPKLLKNSQNSSTPLVKIFENIIPTIEDKGIKDEFYIPITECGTSEEILIVEESSAAFKKKKLDNRGRGYEIFNKV